jgi:hypothetical protein
MMRYADEAVMPRGIEHRHVLMSAGLFGVVVLLASQAVAQPRPPVPFLPGGRPEPPDPVGAIFNLFSARGPTVALFEDDAATLRKHLTGANPPERGKLALPELEPESDDRYAGARSVRLGPTERFSKTIPNWEFRVAERPTSGQYRFIRFAWKKRGGTGIMLQLADRGEWGKRYVAGSAPAGWEVVQVSDHLPTDWEVVTRDLFKDFGPMTITGLALTPYDGEMGLFDHIYLGRTVADLDKLSVPRLGMPAPGPLAGETLDKLWEDLAKPEGGEAARAYWTLASAPAQAVPLFAARLTPATLDPAERARRRQVAAWLADLDADDYAAREAASEGLAKLGAAAVEGVRAALAAGGSPEARRRLERLALLLGDAEVPRPPEERRGRRAVHLLGRFAKPEARAVLQRLAGGDPEAGVTVEARRALAGRGG